MITLNDVSLKFDSDILLDHVKFQIVPGERVCLIGRNGAGKSTFLKIIEGSVQPDSGDVWRQPGLRIARLTQELPQEYASTVYDFVAEGLAHAGQLLAAYHALIHRLSESSDPKDLAELDHLQHAIDACDGWQFEQDIKTVLQRLSLDPDKPVSALSGGWQRRVSLARALVSKPDLLLLDEPTNHLDIEAIQWLENELVSCGVALLFITHDRALLKRLATRIIELDRGHLTSWPGNYENFLRRKEEMLEAQAHEWAEFDKKLAEEERWIRQGIKARRTRNEGRVRALKSLRHERAQRREIQGKVKLSVNTAEKSGQVVVEAKNITHSYQGQCVVKNFSLRVMRNDRIGLIGPNGIGKSTLLNLLLGEVTPDQGVVTQGTKLQVGYFDQLRQKLDLERTVLENVGQGSDFIEINGKKRHIISYLADFLFTPQRVRSLAKALSGGECNRLLLARLFSQPSNLLVLDEPTNDLDIETLELLEELLSEHQGTLLIVSHDRAFLNNVVTSTLVFEGDGKIQEYIGGYDDWQRQQKSAVTNKLTEKQSTEKKKTIQDKQKNTKKLSYNDQKALQELPLQIEQMEKEQAALQHYMADPEFYKQSPEKIAETTSALKALCLKLESAYQKWENLEK